MKLYFIKENYSRIRIFNSNIDYIMSINLKLFKYKTVNVANKIKQRQYYNNNQFDTYLRYQCTHLFKT